MEGIDLVHRPYDENSDFDSWSAVDAAANGTHRLFVVGDWSSYREVDRVGTTVSYLPPGVLQKSIRYPQARRLCRLVRLLACRREHADFESLPAVEGHDHGLTPKDRGVTG